LREREEGLGWETSLTGSPVLVGDRALQTLPRYFHTNFRLSSLLSGACITQVPLDDSCFSQGGGGNPKPEQMYGRSMMTENIPA